MHERHVNKEKYFQEQEAVIKKYVIPYINRIHITDDLTVAEIGCGVGGGLKPFLDIGCKVYGIDIAKNSIETAKAFYDNHPLKENLTLIAEDIYNITPDKTGLFDLIIMHDTLEHIYDQDDLLSHIRKLIYPGGKIFIGFPPWRMPFGGHQQMCENKFISKVPYFHLLPKGLYIFILKLFGENPSKINGLLEIRDTRISIQRFKKIVRKNNFMTEKEDFYLINPSYEIKFNLKARKLPRFLNISWLRDFYTTTCYCVLT